MNRTATPPPLTPGPQGRWEHFPHGADIGIRGMGPTQEAAFGAAALALTAVMVDPGAVAATERVEVTCAGRDAEDLFYAWLNAVVYEMATRRMVFGSYAVSIEGNRLSAVMGGERISPRRHAPAVEIKGATYTALSVRREDDGWVAECVVDV